MIQAVILNFEVSLVDADVGMRSATTGVFKQNDMGYWHIFNVVRLSLFRLLGNGSI